MEDGRLIGIVDDDAILRVVVAETDAPEGGSRHDRRRHRAPGRDADRPAVVEMVLEHARLWALFLVVACGSPSGP